MAAGAPALLSAFQTGNRRRKHGEREKIPSSENNLSNFLQSSTHIHSTSHWPELHHMTHTTRKSSLLASHGAHCHSKDSEISVTRRGNGYCLSAASSAFSLLTPGGQAMVHSAFLSVDLHRLKAVLGRFPPSWVPRAPSFSKGWFLCLFCIPFPGRILRGLWLVSWAVRVSRRLEWKGQYPGTFAESSEGTLLHARAPRCCG